ncbi:MAG TPA: DoxX family membrane protein [Candidatus Eisenbacteria bacterium]|nr:DoxX family membrane protein [Candidatus Eisenbacteria bacterium]
MNRLATVARILLGAGFVVFGLNGFLHFLPNPEMKGPAGAFIGALVSSGYMMTLVAATQVVGGALVLTGVFVPLGLVLLAPILVNIVLFHLVLEPDGIVPGLVFCAFELIVAWHHRRAFRGLFT